MSVIHLQDTSWTDQTAAARWPICGPYTRRGQKVLVTLDRKEVTCKRCLNSRHFEPGTIGVAPSLKQIRKANDMKKVHLYWTGTKWPICGARINMKANSRSITTDRSKVTCDVCLNSRWFESGVRGDPPLVLDTTKKVHFSKALKKEPICWSTGKDLMLTYITSEVTCVSCRKTKQWRSEIINMVTERDTLMPHEENIVEVEPVLTADSFLQIVHVNVGNDNLSDKSFRAFISNTLPVVIYDRPKKKDKS